MTHHEHISPRTALKPRRKTGIFTLLFAIASLLVIFGLGAVVAWAFVKPIPSIDNFESRAVAQSTKIYDRTGNIVLYDVHGQVRRTAVPIEHISPFIQKAAVAIEDEHFYEHSGVRLTSIARALIADIYSGSFKEGGSTITQQVIKNALLTRDKTLGRKLEEMILALRLERMDSKDQILNTYLNETPYGGTIYGVEEASQYFFGVSAKDVDLAQAAYLAALPQAPTHYSPYGDHRDELDARKNLVLEKMKENKFISEAEYSQAIAENVIFKDVAEAGIKAPHFVFYIRDYLEQKYGSDMVNNGGLHVITTLDYDLEQKAEEIVKRYALQNEKTFNASNASIVAIDPKTGQILTMVGSRDYFDPAIDGMVNVATRNRQPGSSFKPFVYATAFGKGYTPETVLFDLKTQFSTACAPNDFSDTPPCYSPDNYDGTFKGPMSLRDALATSENIPAVKLLYLAGIKDSLKVAQYLGITTLSDAGHYGLTLVLGGGEVNLLQMTGAYGVFANDGIKNPTTGILRIEDNRGTILEEYASSSVQVLDPEVARQINDVLSDNKARTPEFGADSPLYFPGADVADKTGTTNDFRDTWIIGYTPSVAAGAWAGNNDNTPMKKKIAALIVAPMWHEFMQYAITKYSAEPFTEPAPDIELPSLPAALQGIWNANPSQGIHDILYWIDKTNPRVPRTNSPWSDPQFARWEYPVQLWAAQSGTQFVQGAIYDNPIGTPSTGPSTPYKITNPQEGSVISVGDRLQASVSLPSNGTITKVVYYLDNTALGTATNPPFTFPILLQSRGAMTLHAVATKSDGTIIEDTVHFSVQ